jgi:atypical dual specificity phosphatase
MMGISRSSTVVCAYLVAEHGMSARDAIAFAKSKRSVVRPNVGFVRQLGEWAQGFVPAPAQESGLSQLRDRLRRILDSSQGVASAQKRPPHSGLPSVTVKS